MRHQFHTPKIHGMGCLSGTPHQYARSPAAVNDSYSDADAGTVILIQHIIEVLQDTVDMRLAEIRDEISAINEDERSWLETALGYIAEARSWLERHAQAQLGAQRV